VSGLLMEAGVPYNQQKVHQKKYFGRVATKAEEGDAAIDAGVITLSRSTVEALTGMQRQLMAGAGKG